MGTTIIFILGPVHVYMYVRAVMHPRHSGLDVGMMWTLIYDYYNHHHIGQYDLCNHLYAID